MIFGRNRNAVGVLYLTGGVGGGNDIVMRDTRLKPFWRRSSSETPPPATRYTRRRSVRAYSFSTIVLRSCSSAATAVRPLYISKSNLLVIIRTVLNTILLLVRRRVLFARTIITRRVRGITDSLSAHNCNTMTSSLRCDSIIIRYRV